MLTLVLVIVLTASIVLTIERSSFGDIVIISLCCLSVIAANGYLLYALKKRRIADIPPMRTILLIYNNVIFFSSLVPLFVIGTAVSVSGVKAVVTNIYVFYWIALGLMLTGFIITLFLISKSIRKSNWWVFLASIPYVVTSWIIQRDYTGFDRFVHADNFTYKNVAQMLKDVDRDMLLLNPTWYKFLSILIITLFLMMGMIAVENVWKKTSEWR